MDALWERIEHWLGANAPEMASGLNGPASEAEIASTEQLLGVRFPADVRASFLRHDGQSSGSPWLMDGWEWLSLSRVRDEWKVWKGLLDGGDFAGAQSEGDDVIVRSDWWHPAWAPLTYSGSGDHHCLDLAPGPQGREGQIIEMWHDSGERPVVAESFRAWLEQFAADLEAGRYAISAEYGGLCRIEDGPEPVTSSGAGAPAVPQPAAPWGEQPLPAAFEAEGEPVKLLARAKARAAKNFRWKKAACLYEAVALAQLLHVFGRDEEALEICAALGEYRFSGGYELWSAVERALALRARLLRTRGDTGTANECVRRMEEAGFVDDRLEGSMLDRNGSVAEAMKDGDKKWEQAGRLSLASELAFIIELRRGRGLPTDDYERQWAENQARLRLLTGAPV